jgi:hypothetical protein
MHLPFLRPRQKLSRVFGGQVVKCHGEKEKKKRGPRGVSKNKKEENFDCLPVPYSPWLYLEQALI